jgi:hypothetical protein
VLHERRRGPLLLGSGARKNELQQKLLSTSDEGLIKASLALLGIFTSYLPIDIPISACFCQ